MRCMVQRWPLIRALRATRRVRAPPMDIVRLADCFFRAWRHQPFATILGYAGARSCARFAERADSLKHDERQEHD